MEFADPANFTLLCDERKKREGNRGKGRDDEGKSKRGKKRWKKEKEEEKEKAGSGVGLRIKGWWREQRVRVGLKREE